jgi:diadenosine tetraphosphatase ApaH/serine/threonine PP2A family protein phosphatase
MRILIISDIHANKVALDTVLAAAGSVDRLWCLGDTIGYGPEPNACVETVMNQAQVIITGNHDLACIGELDLDDFNPDARTANIWNGEQLAPENLAWLKELSPRKRIDDQVTVAHASPREPVWEYLLSVEQAMVNFTYFDTQICLIGHSHVQLGFHQYADGHCERFLPSDVPVIELVHNSRYFINPGSVGQPRDYDPRAAYAILDTDKGIVTYNRVEYDIKKTQKKMYDANLPINLIRRLEFGM